ncbi:MAG: DUF4361 domain-containing protein [Tannerella sp.]|nr:DUF4361 domain-containing protein [Tannerella sp.]
MMTKIKLLSVSLCLMLLAACSNEVDFGEQYKKTVYIVNATDYTGDHSYAAENDAIVISIYCASSKPITKDLKARLMVDPYVLDSLNHLNELSNSNYIKRVLLPQANYQMPDDPIVTIKANEQYGTLNIPFNFNGLDPDKFYALPLYLSANNENYDITENLRVILYQVNMVNDYSGSFNGRSTEVPENETDRVVVKTVQPTVKALSKNTVRLPIHDANIDDTDNMMLLTIAGDGSVSITPWENSTVTDLGGSHYNAVKMQYELNYRYKGKVISEIITNILAPKTDEDIYN